ncbi:Diguanylate Cyclase and Two-component system sensory domain-containing protein [Haladaptatus litoreus]|uniref:Diguanylate Cyclase and Two-component system sensory domain-containing protein n=1 Tax=Haladaptatus litoreus TaxID=553468 RepID=A0A1N6W9Q6_9EURY|nr:DICT sensory domain-containing protein [Haladaptatus litoreus]SIQ86889.1 Diguanylate Cyclase and Two-component system sensory domain-containing protein [Haladaptatus litoreus]
MTLHEHITTVEREQKTLVVYAADPDTDLAEQFETKNVAVQYKRLRSVGGDEFLVVRDDGEFKGTIGLQALTEFLTPPITVPWSDEGESSLFRDLLSVLDRTLFTSFDKRQMLATSREIEDRAWRVGDGELHVGFQSPSAFRAQEPVYDRLADETNLDIHIYGSGEWRSFEMQDVTFHGDETDEIGKTWFLVYDGGGDPLQKCALLAEEHDPDQFYGFWTYDPKTVDELLSYLHESYG